MDEQMKVIESGRDTSSTWILLVQLEEALGTLERDLTRLTSAK